MGRLISWNLAEAPRIILTTQDRWSVISSMSRHYSRWKKTLRWKGINTHTHTSMHTHKHTYVHTHTHARPHTHTHTHTHIHTVNKFSRNSVTQLVTQLTFILHKLNYNVLKNYCTKALIRYVVWFKGPVTIRQKRLLQCLPQKKMCCL